MKLTQKQKDGISVIVDDSIRFGACFGSWVKSIVVYQRILANHCIGESKEYFINEIQSVLNESEEKEEKD